MSVVKFVIQALQMVHMLPHYCQVLGQIETCLQVGSTILPDSLYSMPCWTYFWPVGS